MASRAPEGEQSAASRLGAWPLVAVLPVIALVSIYLLGPIEYHADDQKWLSAVGHGLSGLGQPHPLNHFRPSFFAWLTTVDIAAGGSPASLGFAGVLVQLTLIWLAYVVAREWMSTRDAAVSAAIFAIHPVRQTHWFWTSAQIDSLCLAFILLTVIVAARAMRQGTSTGRLLLLALTTAAAALSKETAYALPLAISLIPNACSRKTRITLVAFSAIGALAALLWTAAVLDEGGRAAGLLTGANPRIATQYALRLILPFDWFAFSELYNGPGPSRGLWKTLAVLLVVGTTTIVALLVWFRRDRAWARFGLVLILWGGVAWLFHQGAGGDRSIAVGAVGLALVAGGYSHGLSNRATAAALVVLLLFWAPRWLTYVEEWRAVDNYQRNLSSSLEALRDRVGDQVELVVLGTPYTIGESGDPIDIDDLDPRATRGLSLYHANPGTPAAQVEVRGKTVWLRTESPSFLGGCGEALRVGDHVLPEDVLIQQKCEGANLRHGVEIDNTRLAEEVRGALPVAWNGQALVPLVDSD